MTVEVDKLDIAKLVSVSASLNDLKTKLDDLDVGELKAVSMYITKLKHVVKNEVVKNTKLNTLKTKVNELDKKIFRCDFFNSHYSIQQIDKSLRKNLEMLIKKKKKPDVSALSDCNWTRTLNHVAIWQVYLNG